MKIKNLLQAPLILEELKRLNIDPTTLNPNDRIKMIDGCLYFQGEKECFVSKRTEGHQCTIVDKEPIKYDAGPEPIEYSEQLEYYYFKESELFTIQEGDESLENKKWYKFDKSSFGYRCHPTSSNVYRRKIQKNPTT